MNDPKSSIHAQDTKDQCQIEILDIDDTDKKLLLLPLPIERNVVYKNICEILFLIITLINFLDFKHFTYL